MAPGEAEIIGGGTTESAEKRGRGQPPHEPTKKDRATVSAMTSYGIPQDAIAAVIGISEPTLRKHYAHEIATAFAVANERVAKRLFEHATGDSVAAAIFWLKARAGWSEKSIVVNQHTGGDGVPLVDFQDIATATSAYLSLIKGT